MMALKKRADGFSLETDLTLTTYCGPSRVFLRFDLADCK